MPLGPLEIILIIVVIALLFGAKKLPELGRGLGQGIKEFKAETREANKPGPDAALLNPELRAPAAQTDIVDVQATELRAAATAEPVSVAADQRDRQG